MFYISCKSWEKFGVLDTKDDIVEYYTKEELIKITEEYGIKILGFSKYGKDGCKIVHLQDYYRQLDLSKEKDVVCNKYIFFCICDEHSRQMYIGVKEKATDTVIYYHQDSILGTKDMRGNKFGAFGFNFANERDGVIYLCLGMDYDEGGSSLPSALNVTLKIDITTNKVKVVDIDDGDEGYYYFDKEKCCIRFKSEYY